ncbi:DNA-processing protein DprA [Microbacterium sp. NPDC078428]|uniref:DNA-processing protein DprA n=1 Tax=Microbacterium sp. NPDC078428 TaxID=3364190 RepID=UPI0037C58B9C
MTAAELAGWSERRRRDDLRGLGPASEDDAAMTDRWARAVWSLLAEPGDRTARALIEAVGAMEALLVVAEKDPGSALETPGAVSDGLRRWRPRLRRGGIEAMFHTARAAGVSIHVPGDPAWPMRVDDLGDHAPVCLWARGSMRMAAADGPAVALIGARASTAYGERIVIDMAAELVGAGVRIVSGAAHGIDGAAHRAALAGGGVTLAVLAGGLDRPYPTGHSDLIARIAATGTVLSEIPPGGAPTKWRFLARNRTIAALADAVIVVEAGWRSGSLNTAGHAATLGRPLGAVPGPVTSGASAGCHRLLREYDAVCVTGPEDVLSLLGGSASVRRAVGPATDDSTRVLDALSTRADRSVDDVARRAGLAPADCGAILALLELEGVARRGAVGWRRAAAVPARGGAHS